MRDGRTNAWKVVCVIAVADGPTQSGWSRALGRQGTFWASSGSFIVSRGCTVSSLFSVFGYSLNTVIIRGTAGKERVEKEQSAALLVRAPGT